MENQELLTLPKGQATHANPELDAEQSRLWEKNHKKIMDYISIHLSNYKEIPSISQISESTKLSRPTIRKHIRDFYSVPEFKDQVGLYRLMAANVMKKLYTEATCGHVRSARLFMELIGVIKTGRTEVNNNFVGINQTLKVNDIELTEDLLQNMSKENKDKLAELLKEAMGGNPLPKTENI